jgi:hypothetical protein
MRLVVVHIEIEDDTDVEELIDEVLIHYTDTIGWRYFDSLEEAQDWEDHGTYPSHTE